MMIKEYDIVLIKEKNIVGTVVDIYKNGDQTIYNVEDNKANEKNFYNLYACKESDLKLP